jgi:outer membrane protein assembly factor BamB
LALAALVCVTRVPGVPGAEDGDGEDDAKFDPRVYLDSEEEASGLLRAASRARSAEPPNWRAAIEKYLEVNTRFGNTMFASSDRLYLPVRELVRKEMDELPREGRDFYKAFKSREAELAVRRALTAGSFADLAAVPDLYPRLEQAATALYTLAEWCRARGDLVRAQIYWRQLLDEYPDWSGAGITAVAARAALAASESGRGGEGSQALETLRKHGALTRLRVAGREMAVADEVASRLKAAATAHTVPAESGGGEWHSIGGGAAHDGFMIGTVDAGIRRWLVPMGTPVDAQTRQQYAAQGVPLPQSAASRFPVCAAGMVILSGESDLAAFRVRSGQLAWPASRRGQPNLQLPAARMCLPAVGQEQVYAVLGQFAQANPYNRFQQQQQTKAAAPVLRAYSLSGGKLKWEGGASADSATRAFLRDVELVPVPVYAGGLVYCPAVKRGSINDVYMLCFDAADGRLLWKTFICAGQQLGGTYGMQLGWCEDVLPPAVGDGVVAVATNVGAVAVLDAFSGRTLWVYLYDRPETPLGHANIFGRRGNTTAEPDVWRPSAPIISGGLVLTAPQDSTELLALGVADGRVRWKSRRGSLRRLVGVEGGRLLCTGGKEAVCFAASSGKRLWRTPLASDEAGLGLMGAGYAVIPTAGGLLRVDTVSGKVMTVCRFKNGREEAGNLAVAGDVLVCAGAAGLGGYYSWEDIVSKLRARIAEEPDAAAPRAEMAEIYFSADRYAEAAGFFREVIEKAKPGERSEGTELVPQARRQIWESHSRLGASMEGEKRYAEALEQYRQAHAYAQSDAEKMLGHLRFARSLEATGDAAAAVADYQAVIRSFWPEMYEEAGRRVAAGAFAKAQIDRLIAARGAAVYARFEAEAAEVLKRAEEKRSAELAESVVGGYPNSGAVSPALLLIGELLTAEGRHADAAVRLREHAAKCRNAPRALEAGARLAQSYRAQGLGTLADAMLRRMLRDQPGRTFRLGDREWTVENFVAGQSVAAGPAGPALARPDLTPPFRKQWESSVCGPIPVMQPEQEPSGVFLTQGTRGELFAVDLKTGKALWRTGGPQAAPQQPVFYHGRTTPAAVSAGVVTAVVGGSVSALSLRDGKKLWETDLPGTPEDSPEAGGAAQVRSLQCAMAAADGLVVVAPAWARQNPAGGQQWSSRVSVLDQATGRLVWSGEDLPVASPVLLFEDGIIFCAGSEANRGMVRLEAYDAFDGRRRFSAQLPGAVQLLGMEMSPAGLLMLDSQMLRCFDSVSGKLRWTARTNANSAVIVAVDASRVVLGISTADRGRQACSAAAFDLASGKKLWSTTPVPGYMNTPRGWQQGVSPYASEAQNNTGQVFLVCAEPATGRGQLLVYDGESGKMLWKAQCQPRAAVSSLSQGARHVIATLTLGQSGKLCAWETASGKLVHEESIGGGRLLQCEDAVLLLAPDRTGRTKLTRLTPVGAAAAGGENR